MTIRQTNRRRTYGRGIAACVVALTLCSTGAATAAFRKLHLHKPARGFQMRMKTFVIQPGGDREGCEYAVAPNKQAVDVSEFQLRATPGTHHFVVWQYTGADHDPADFWKGIAYSPGCVGLGPQQNGGTIADLFGMLPENVRFRFPDGVAVRLDPHAIVFPNLHFHNYTTIPILGQAVFNFIPAKKGTVQHHAQSFTVGSTQIDIPPQGTGTLTGEWHAPVDLNMVQFSTHQHHRGTRMTIHQIDANGADLGELVTSDNWEHPTVQWYQTALRIPAGNGIRFTCEWSNPDDKSVHFGPTSEDEMCFATGYFYPDDDNAKVAGPGCIPQGGGLICFVPNVAAGG